MKRHHITLVISGYIESQEPTRDNEGNPTGFSRGVDEIVANVVQSGRNLIPDFVCTQFNISTDTYEDTRDFGLNQPNSIGNTP